MTIVKHTFLDYINEAKARLSGLTATGNYYRVEFNDGTSVKMFGRAAASFPSVAGWPAP